MSAPAITSEHLAMVLKNAKLLRRRYCLPIRYLDELIAAGHFGLVEARHRFEPQAGASFDTYAWYRVRFAMIDALRFANNCSRRQIEERKRPPRALTAAPQDQRFVALEDLPSEAELADAQADASRAAAATRAALATLPARMRRLVHGVHFDGLTIEDAGAAIGISKSWASRVHASALAKMRAQLEQAKECA